MAASLTTGPLEITEVDLTDRSAYDAWHATFDLGDRYGREELASAWSLEELWLRLTEPNRRRWTTALSGRVGNDVVVAAYVETPLLDNLDLLDIGLAVHPDHRRAGHGSAMIAAVESIARERHRTTLTAMTAWPYESGPGGDGSPGREFARANGFELMLEDIQRHLTLPVPEELLASLAAEAAAYHRDYTIQSFVGPVPDELLLGWAELTATLMTEAPTGDRDLEPEAVDLDAVREDQALTAKQGRTKYNSVALNAEGEVVAYTDIATSGQEIGRAYQWGTLVRRADRGHRLGLAVKAANLQLLQRERSDVERVITWNAEVNAHMVGVNERLGFRPVERSGEFQKKLER